MTSLFVFAHQDDDYGIFHGIAESSRKGSTYCIYLTDGGRISERRNKESLNVLGRLGVKRDHIFFLGQKKAFSDGKLFEQLEAATLALAEFLEQHNSITQIYVPAWEGGHIDHDATHAATILAARKLAKDTPIFQFSLYNSKGCMRPLYNVMHPLPYAEVQKSRIPIAARLKYVTLPMQYPSQWKVWLGLYPFICYQYLVLGEQQLQLASFERIWQRPHSDALYYERKAGNSYERLHAAICQVASNLHLA